MPEDRKKDFEDPAKRAASFRRWAKDRFDELSVNGVYILMCKSPGRVEPEIGNDTQRRAFTPADMRALMKSVMPLLEEKKQESNDKALGQIVKQVTTSYEEHFKVFRGKADAAPQKKEREDNGIAGWICPAIAIILGIWLMIALVRAFSGGGGGGYGGGGGGGYGGGGGGGRSGYGGGGRGGRY